MLKTLWRNFFWRPSDYLEEFCKEQNIQLRGDYGFAINGLLVNEFGYLLRVVSNGKHDTFQSLDALHADRALILRGIQSELNAQVLTEERLVSHQTALFNMNNLDGIMRKIFALVDKAHELNLPLKMT